MKPFVCLKTPDKKRLETSRSILGLKAFKNIFTPIFKLYYILQESRPLGATLISDCVTLTGCEDEDVDSGVAKELAFRLKLASVTSTGASATPSILCLAADNQADYDSWIHSIAHISQNTNKETVSEIIYRLVLFD